MVLNFNKLGGMPRSYRKIFDKVVGLLRLRLFDEADSSIERLEKISLHFGEDYLHPIYLLRSYFLVVKGSYAKDEALYKEGISFFKKLEGSNLISEVEYLNVYAYYHMIWEDLEEAFYYINKAKDLGPLHNEKILNQLLEAEYYVEKNRFKEANEILNEVETIFDSSTPLILKIQRNQLRILVCTRTNQFMMIRDIGLETLRDCTKAGDVENIIKIKNALGISLAIKGEYKQAFENFIDVKERSEQINFKKYAARALVNLGNTFSALHNYEEAINNFTQVIFKYERAINSVTLGIIYYNLGGIYSLKGDLSNSNNYLKKAYDLGQKNKFGRLISRSLFEIVKNYIQQEEYIKAIEFSKEAEGIIETDDSIKLEATHLANMASLMFYQNRYDEAIDYASKSIEQCKNTNTVKTLFRSYLLISQIYKAKKDFKLAYKYLDLYNQTQNKYLEEVRQKQMIDLQIQYETAEKTKEIEILKSKMQYQELMLVQQKEIEEQNIALRNVNEDLRQFTYAVSHDLKQPMRMISSFSSILQREFKEKATETQDQYFDYVVNGSNRMTGMLEGLLQYATIGTKEMNFEWINLKDVTADILDNLYFQIQDESATIHQFMDIEIYTNRVLITQLIQNLMSNAIKFRKKDVNPVVTVKAEMDLDEVVITIQDNGIGISEEDQLVVFKIFKRLHKSDEYKGTGLGLSMCKKIVNHLRGTIVLESQKGKGTKFIITLPSSDDDASMHSVTS